MMKRIIDFLQKACNTLLCRMTGIAVWKDSEGDIISMPNQD